MYENYMLSHELLVAVLPPPLSFAMGGEGGGPTRFLLGPARATNLELESDALCNDTDNREDNTR